MECDRMKKTCDEIKKTWDGMKTCARMKKTCDRMTKICDEMKKKWWNEEDMWWNEEGWDVVQWLVDHHAAWWLVHRRIVCLKDHHWMCLTTDSLNQLIYIIWNQRMWEGERILSKHQRWSKSRGPVWKKPWLWKKGAKDGKMLSYRCWVINDFFMGVD